MLSRRNALSMLGLTATSSSAFATEDLFPELKKGSRTVSMLVRTEKMVAAFRNLADEIEKHGVNITRVNLSSDVDGKSIVKQVLTVEFIVQAEQES